MITTTRQLVFLLFFILFLLQLLILGDSYLNFVIMGGLVVVLGVFNWHQPSNLKLDWWIVSSWMLLLCTLVVTSLFSVSLPLSLVTISKWFLVFITFWFVYFHPKLLPTQLMIESLLIVGLVMVVLSSVFQLFPNLIANLGGMNLLYASFGHNHLAALLILLIPLSWWWALEDGVNSKIQWWKLFLPGILTLSLLFSFGRVAILIGFFQFSILHHFWQFSSNKLSAVTKIVSFLFIGVLLIKIFFSTIEFFKPDYVCPAPALKQQLCKSIDAEARPHYWLTAWQVFKHQPLLGTGPGTYQISSQKYQLIPTNDTFYAHNEILQAMSDMGLLGGVSLLFLMLVLLLQSLKKARKGQRVSWQWAAILSVSSIYLDVMFDFDWQFVGILLITFILLSLLLREETSIQQNLFWQKIIKSLSLILSGFLVILALIYIWIEILIGWGDYQRAFETFPYFPAHMKIYQMSPTTINNNQEEFLAIYGEHPDAYRSLLINDQADLNSQLLLEKLINLDPWQLNYYDNAGYYLENDLLDLAGEQILLKLEFWQKMQARQVYFASYQDLDKLIAQTIILGDKYQQLGDAQLAAKWYSLAGEQQIAGLIDLVWESKLNLSIKLVSTANQLATTDMKQTLKLYQQAQQLVSWILSSELSWFETHDLSTISTSGLINYSVWTQNQSSADIGWHQEERTMIVVEIMRRLLADQNYSQLREIARLTTQLPDLSQDLLNNLVLDLQIAANQAQQNQDNETAMQLVLAISDIGVNDYWPLFQPAALAALQGNHELAQNYLKKCLEKYQQAHQRVHITCDTYLYPSTKQLTPDIYWKAAEIILNEPHRQ